MKKKVFNKKLSLNKETVSKLNEVEMMNVKGGLNSKYENAGWVGVNHAVGSHNTCGGESTC